MCLAAGSADGQFFPTLGSVTKAVTSSAGCRVEQTSAGCHVTSKVLGRLSRHGRTKSLELGNLAAFAHFFGPKESGDEAVTNGDKLGGMEFACFSGLKTESRAT